MQANQHLPSLHVTTPEEIATSACTNLQDLSRMHAAAHM